MPRYAVIITDMGFAVQDRITQEIITETKRADVAARTAHDMNSDDQQVWIAA